MFIQETLQSPAVRKLAIIGVTLIVCFSTWLVYSKLNQRRREAAYQAKIAPLREALTNGTPMTAVSRYLNSHGIGYRAAQHSGNNWSYQVKIGEEAGDHVVCAKWTVYAAMEFGADKRLTDVHLKKVGTCL